MKRIIATALIGLLSLGSLHAAEKRMKLTTIDGKTINITETQNGLDIDAYRGQIVILDFFGHRCPPCIASIPHQNALQKKYKGKVKILAIEVQGMQKPSLESFVEYRKINYDVATNADSDGLSSYIAKRVYWKGPIPFMLVLNQKGDLEFTKVGMISESQMESIIEKLLAKESNKSQKTTDSNKTADSNNTTDNNKSK